MISFASTVFFCRKAGYGLDAAAETFPVHLQRLYNAVQVEKISAIAFAIVVLPEPVPPTIKIKTVFNCLFKIEL